MLKGSLNQEAGRLVDQFAFLQQATGNELREEGRICGGGLNKIERRELSRISAIALLGQWPELNAILGPQGNRFREGHHNVSIRSRETNRQRPSGQSRIDPWSLTSQLR
jgi:hypothetical protein